MWEITVRDASGQVEAQGTLASGALRLGRHADNDLVIRDPAMSRQHAAVEMRDGVPWIVDLGSVNGVLVDGVRISAPRPVDESSRVEISGWRIELSRDVPDETADPLALDPEPAEEAAEPPPPPAPAAAPAAPRPADDEAARTAAHLLEQKISSIRSHRQQQLSARDLKRQEFEAEWNQVLDEMRALRARLRDEKRVRYFTVGRDGDQVALKVERSSGQTSLLMTRGHPDRPVGGEERIYVRDHVWPDRSFASPRDALNELLSHIASLLA